MTRANTERPTGARGLERPKAGGEHHDSLESGLPSDVRSEGAGTSDKGTGYKPGSGETAEEKGNYGSVEHGNAKGAAGTMPSTSRIDGARGTIGDGRGSSGKFSGTMGSGAKGEPGLSKCKGTIGNC
jgi:hypothetical protein